jgi:hypothetical protein
MEVTSSLSKDAASSFAAEPPLDDDVAVVRRYSDEIG